MEKVVAALWAGLQDRQAFNAELLAELPPALHAAGATRIRINIRDEAVASGAGLVQQWQSPQQDAIVQFWLPSANAFFREPADEALGRHCDHLAAWLVVESTIIENTQHSPRQGERCGGWSQSSFISFCPDLSHEEAVHIWHTHHTRVAIDTQANFEYVQNLIVQPLTPDAPAYGAFVEECFPLEALTDPMAFYDAVGNKEKFDANLATMMDSCGRFIDFSRIDIIPTSQYNYD